MDVIGYHTLEDRDNVDEVEEHGPFKCIRPNAWLGQGYYFWDTNIAWAHEWGLKGLNGRYMICQATIRIDDRCMDLVGNVRHLMEFEEICKLLQESDHFRNKNNITVGQVIEFMKRKKMLDYDAIRATDYPRNVLKVYYRDSSGGRSSEFMFLNPRVQICLINKKNLVLSSFRVIFPDKYKD